MKILVILNVALCRLLRLAPARASLADTDVNLQDLAWEMEEIPDDFSFDSITSSTGTPSLVAFAASILCTK